MSKRQSAEIPFANNLEELVELLAAGGFGGDRSRPYRGQSWTYEGKRGLRSVPTMTYRTLADSIVRALASFPFHFGDPDHAAIAQCVLRQVEIDHQDWPDGLEPDAKELGAPATEERQ